jgi:hypothetical protein
MIAQLRGVGARRTLPALLRHHVRIDPVIRLDSYERPDAEMLLISGRHAT